MSSQEEDSFTYFHALVEVCSRYADDDDDEVKSRFPDDGETEEEREIRLGGTLVPLAESERMLGIYRDEHGRIIPYDPDHGLRNKIKGDDNDDVSPNKAATIPRKSRYPRRVRRSFSDENLRDNNILKQERLLKRPMEEEEDDFMTTEKKHKKKKKMEKTVGKIEAGGSNRAWDEEYFKIEKKRKRNEEGSPKKTSPRNRISNSSSDIEYTVPDPAPPLPDNVRARMEEEGPFDGEPVLVLQRILNATDLSDHHNRLAMPIKQILNDSFLREDEKKYLEEKREVIDSDTKKKKKRGSKVKDPTKKRGSIETRVVLPSLKIDEITLRMWPMLKKGSTSNSNQYVLNGRWKVLLADEEKRGKPLMENMVVQIWAYRVYGQLRFALVNLGAFSLDHLGNIIQVSVPIPTSSQQTPILTASSQQEEDEDEECN